MPTPPHRLAIPFLRAVLALLLVALGAPAAIAQGVRVEQALAIEADASRFPAERVARPVALPDDWSASRPGAAGPVWYRIAFDAAGAHMRRELLALYVERACSNLEVQLNGERIEASGRMHEPYTHNCHYPQLVALPVALLRERGNLLDIKLVGEPLQRVASGQRAAGLSALEIGPHAALAARQRQAHLLHVTLPQLAAAGLLLMGAVLLVIAGGHRSLSHLRYFAALAIGWALLGARAWWRDPPLPFYDTELLVVSLVPAVVLATVLFLLRYAGYRSRPLEVALYAQCAIVPASLLMAGPSRLHMIASTWYVMLALQVLAAVAFFLWMGRRRRRWASTLLAGAGVAAVLAAELAAQGSALRHDAAWLAQLALPAALLAIGLRLVWQYAERLRHAEAGRQNMESRVREITDEIERNFAQLAELRVEQVTERERKRIAADLHDDLGAKLLTIVHTSEDQRISTLAREALEEMRLSVRGLTGKPVKLIDALGDWRAEVISRLQQAGIEAEWNSPVDDLPQTLTARAYVQTTRILREAVNNIIKHSGASRCGLRCTIAEGDFQLVIQDNGKGIPLELDGRLDRGHGMASMKHRAKQLHGQCLVESGPGYGTVIRLTLPLERQVEEA